MGVYKLKQLLKIGTEGPKQSISSLRGQSLAVDAAVWLHEFTRSSHHISQVFHLGYEQDLDAELETFLLDRVKLLSHFDITLIFVAEGDVNPSKSGTNQKRASMRIQQQQKLDELLKSDSLSNLNDVRKCIKATTENTPGLWFSLNQFCKKYNFHLVSGVMEADPQLVALNWLNYVSGIITIDTDIIPLGFGHDKFQIILDIDFKSCRNVKDSISGATNDAPCTILDNKDIMNKLKSLYNIEWTRDDFILLCTFLGTDFWLHSMVFKKAIQLMFTWFQTENRQISNVHKFIHDNNIFNHDKNGTEFQLAINAMVYPLVYHLTYDDFQHERFSSIKICFLHDIQSSKSPPEYDYVSVAANSRRLMSTFSRKNFQGTNFKLLGFSLMEKEHWKDQKLWPSFYIMAEWPREYGTDKYKYQKLIYSDEEPKGSMINFDKMPIKFCEISHLNIWLEYRGHNAISLGNISHNNLINMVSKLVAIESVEGSLIRSYFGPKEFSKYELHSDFVQREGSLIRFDPKSDETDQKIIKIIKDELLVVDDAIIDKMNQNLDRYGVKQRAFHRVTNAHFDLATMTCKECTGTVEKLANRKLYLLQIKCTPSQKSEDYMVSLYIDKGNLISNRCSLLLAPYSRCDCLSGRMGCSHLLGFLTLLRLLQNYRVKDVVAYLPQHVQSFHNTPIPVANYADWQKMKGIAKNKVDEALRLLKVPRDDSSLDDEQNNYDDNDSDTKKNFFSLCTSIDTWFASRSFDSDQLTSKQQKQDKKKSQVPVIRRLATLDDIKDLQYKLLLRGPNSDRDTKIEALLVHDKYDKAYHEGPLQDRMKPSVYSHYLYYTRSYRKALLDTLESSATVIQVEKKIGFQHIPPGYYVLADRGFARCSSCFPNYSAVLCPSFVLKREQFELEEVKDNISICRLRYSSEVFFSRVTDFAVMKGVLELNDIKHFNAHLAFNHAMNNIAYAPLSKPDNWNDYLELCTKSNEDEDVITVQKKKRNRSIAIGYNKNKWKSKRIKLRRSG